MPIRKGKLHKPCRKCGEMYPAHTKTPGICNKCNPHADSFINKLALLSDNINIKIKEKINKRINKHDCKYNSQGKYCDNRKNTDTYNLKTSKLMNKKRCSPKYCPLEI